jgi:hypothetical protein
VIYGSLYWTAARRIDAAALIERFVCFSSLWPRAVFYAVFSETHHRLLLQ